MTADNVDYLPIWKKGSTAEEFLMEVAAIARKHPERFGRIAVIYEQTLEDGSTKVDYQCKNTTTTELMGVIELAKDQIIRNTRA